MRTRTVRRPATLFVAAALAVLPSSLTASPVAPRTSFGVLLSGGTDDRGDSSPFYDPGDAALQFDAMQVAIRIRILLAAGTPGPIRNLDVSATLDGVPMTLLFLGTDTDGNGTIDFLPDPRFPDEPYVDILAVTPDPLPSGVQAAHLQVSITDGIETAGATATVKHDAAKNAISNVRFSPSTDGFGFPNPGGSDFLSVRDHFGPDNPSLLFFQALRSFRGRSLGAATSIVTWFLHPELKPYPSDPGTWPVLDPLIIPEIDDRSYHQQVMRLSSALPDAISATETDRALAEIDAGRPVVLVLGGAETEPTVPILAARHAIVAASYTGFVETGEVWLHGGDPDRPLVGASAYFDPATGNFHYVAGDAESVAFTRLLTLTDDEISGPRSPDEALDLKAAGGLIELAAIEERKKCFVSHFECGQVDISLDDDTGNILSIHPERDSTGWVGGVNVAVGDVNGDGTTCTAALLLPAIQKIRMSSSGRGDTDVHLELYYPADNGTTDIGLVSGLSLAPGAVLRYEEDAAGGLGTSVGLDVDGDGTIDESTPIGVFSVDVVRPAQIPTSIVLDQNYPNPFNPSTAITVTLAESEAANLAVFDLTGREIAVLHRGMLPAGRHVFMFSDADLASGIYLYRLRTETTSVTRTMALVR